MADRAIVDVDLAKLPIGGRFDLGGDRCNGRHDPDDVDEMDGCPTVEQTCTQCPATGPRYMFEDDGLCVSCELARDHGLTCRATGEEGT